jgi:hypothetical protein
MLARIRKVYVAAGMVACMSAASACGDDLGFNAFEVPDPVSLTVYALNGTAQTLPAGVDIRLLDVVRVDPNFAFDLAFDLNASNEVVVHTVRNVSTELVNLPRIGLQTSTFTFDQLIDSPASGFTYDSLLTVPIGTTVVVDKIDPTCNRFGGAFLGFNIRAKFVIDSISTSRRAMYLKVLSNPNCGFKSLEPGEPKD